MVAAMVFPAMVGFGLIVARDGSMLPPDTGFSVAAGGVVARSHAPVPAEAI
jgi:hypothetical protein